MERLSHSGTWLVAPAAVAERARGRVASIAPGEQLELEPVAGVEVAAVAAYNTSKRDRDGRVFHPREAGWVGFDLNVRGERLYHSGDTDVIPEMDSVVGVDVALLPVSGTYVMTAEEAAEAARRIQPRLAVPMHWGEHIGTRADAEAFAREGAGGGADTGEGWVGGATGPVVGRWSSVVGCFALRPTGGLGRRPTAGTEGVVCVGAVAFVTVGCVVWGGADDCALCAHSAYKSPID